MTHSNTTRFFLMMAGLLGWVTDDAGRVFAQSTEPYFYVVAADPQLFFKQKDDQNWRTTIEHINRLKPDFMIVCGDLTQCANDPAKWEQPGVIEANNKLAEAYLNVAAKLSPDIPLRNVAGNHDVSLRPNPKTLAWYESRFGKPWYTFEHKNSLFVILESNLLRDPSGAPDQGKEQWDWLDRTLADSRSKTYDHKTVYMHHPLCLKDVNEPDAYMNIPGIPRAKLLKKFKEHHFSAVFCGHYHRNAYVKDGDLELITTSSCGAALGKDPLGFRIVKVYPDRLEHTYYGFEALPDHVLLKPKKN